jgi:hypothetical protein
MPGAPPLDQGSSSTIQQAGLANAMLVLSFTEG